MLFVDSFMHFTSHKILHCQCTEKEVELIEFLYSSYLSNGEVLFKCATHSLFFNKVKGIRPATLLKKRPATLLKKETLAQAFSCEV